MKNRTRGSALGVTIVLSAAAMVIAASYLSLINTQRRVDLQKELQLKSYLAAETAADYAYNYVINDIQKNTLNAAGSIPEKDYKAFSLSTEIENFVKGSVKVPVGYKGATTATKIDNLSVRVLPATTTAVRYFVDGNAYPNDPNKNQWVSERMVPIVARAESTQAGQKHVAYVQKSIAAREVYLFQHAIFFQGQLHLHRGYRPMGAVHANGNLFLNAHDGDKATYNGEVTTASNFYRGSAFDNGGTGSDAYGYTPVNTAGELDMTVSPKPSLKVTGTEGSIQILIGSGKDGGIYKTLGAFDSKSTNWKVDAEKNFKGYLKDKSHNVPTLTPIGSEGYRQDVKATADVNEFRNDPYALIEPNLPEGHPAHKANLSNSLEAQASLVFIIEANVDTDPADKVQVTDSAGVSYDNTTTVTKKGVTTTTITNLLNPGGSGNRTIDPWRMFRVKLYKVNNEWSADTGKDIHPKLTAIPMPNGVIGAANSTVRGIAKSGVFEDYEYSVKPNAGAETVATPVIQTSLANALDSNVKTSTASVRMTKGFFNSRLGRGVVPLTIDLAALKYVLETPKGSLTDPTHIAFRDAFDPTASAKNSKDVTVNAWNGVLYVEFPTSLEIDSSSAINQQEGVKTQRFKYGSIEKRHPDRASETNPVKDRSDKIVPMAPQLREYPANAKNSTILSPRYAIPSLQLINGRELPYPNQHDSARKDFEGFTVATNAPVYIVGNYNSDGDYTTGTNISSSSADAYAEKDPGIKEIPAAIFCDTLTVLSNGWGETPGSYVRSNRENSFYGANEASTKGKGSTSGALGTIAVPPGRPARNRPAFQHPISLYNFPQTGTYVEISACIATGEYPIFEFFTHALEDHVENYNKMGSTKANPIIFKGSMVSMFHSELQHIKVAYDRVASKDIQSYWQDHGAHAIAAARYHKTQLNGIFPPGTPKAYVTAPKEFRLLRAGDEADAATIKDAGF